jgi:hypothetical protein
MWLRQRRNSRSGSRVVGDGWRLAQPEAPVLTTRARSAPVFTLYFENVTFSGTDQHYTNGVKLSW